VVQIKTNLDETQIPKSIIDIVGVIENIQKDVLVEIIYNDLSDQWHLVFVGIGTLSVNGSLVKNG
jgi:hypothetical protein